MKLQSHNTQYSPSGFTPIHLLLGLAAVAIIATAVIYTVDRLSPTVSPDPLRAAIERHGLTVTGRGQSTGTIQLTSSYLAQVPGSLDQIACNKSGYDLTASPDAEATITKYPIAQRYQDAATNEPLDALVFHQGNRVLCLYKAVRGGAISPGVFGADEDTIAPFSSAPVGDQAVCTADAKQCPDGSYVSRVAPTCEFAECPETNTNAAANVNAVTNTNTADVPADWKTYTNNAYNYSIQYPPSWKVSAISQKMVEIIPPDAASKTSIERSPSLNVTSVDAIEPGDCSGSPAADKRTVTVNGISVIRQSEGCLYGITAAYFPQGSKFISVGWPEDFTKDYPEYEIILSTFTFTN